MCPPNCSSANHAVWNLQAATKNVTSPASSGCDLMTATSSAASSSSSSSSRTKPRQVQRDVSGPAPCSHNMWVLQRWLDENMSVVLKCHVCKLKWVTQLTQHTKCSGFYSGRCAGECGRPHIFARGALPKNIVQDEEGNVVSYELVSLRTAKSSKGKTVKVTVNPPAAAASASDCVEKAPSSASPELLTLEHVDSRAVSTPGAATECLNLTPVYSAVSYEPAVASAAAETFARSPSNSSTHSGSRPPSPAATFRFDPYSLESAVHVVTWQ